MNMEDDFHKVLDAGQRRSFVGMDHMTVGEMRQWIVANTHGKYAPVVMITVDSLGRAYSTIEVKCADKEDEAELPAFLRPQA